jgi:hypothetical protein
MHSTDVFNVAGVSSNVQPEEDEGIILQPNIMEGPEDRLSRPHNMEVDLWTEVLRLNKYLGQRTHSNLLQEIWNLNIIFSLLYSVADPGCLSRILLFSIPDPGSSSKNLSILTQKMVSKL